MSAAPFFALEPTAEAHRWTLAVHSGLAVGPPDAMFLFGGVGVAAAVAAMERTTGRPAIWATAQYLSFAHPGATVEFEVAVPSAGRMSSQARVAGRVGAREIITVTAALGARRGEHDGQWLTMPQVPPPADCPLVRHWRDSASDLKSRFEQRVAHGRFPGGQPIEGRGAGRLMLWIRPVEGQPIDRTMLAILGDFVSAAIPDAVGHHAGGNSLDNTIRFGRPAETGWVLCDMRIEAIHAGIVQGAMHLFAENGTLLASASQSLILRRHA